MRTVQFSGIYQITNVTKADGTAITEEQKAKALGRFFRKQDGAWAGASGGGSGPEGSTAWLSTVRDGKLYLANDDERGRDGSRISGKINGLSGESALLKTAWRMVGVHHLAKAYLGLKQKLYVNPRTSQLLGSSFKNAQPAVLEIATEPENLFEERIIDCSIKPL